MATPALSEKKKIAIAKLSAQGLNQQEIAAQLEVSTGAVSKFRHYLGPQEMSDEHLEKAIRTHLKQGPITARHLAESIGTNVSSVLRAIMNFKRRGVLVLELPGDHFAWGSTAVLEPGRIELKGDAKAEWTHHFGLVSDNHLCNRNSRLDVLNAAYDHFEQQGITNVFNCGNWIDGEARFNKNELLTAPGMDNQLDYMIEMYPQKDGITTRYVAGDDHEGWYAQREGVEIGKYLQMRAEDQGRNDLQYLGYGECDVMLKCGTGSAAMRVLHPGGGSAYATSYTAQKIVESYQGGEKPHVLLIGHYHKFEYGYPREVHCIQAGCTEDQSLFMRKKKIAAHVGFCEVKIRQDSRGAVVRCAVEWFPYYDRGYYERRFK
jgi:predicted transcriptional regulator